MSRLRVDHELLMAPPHLTMQGDGRWCAPVAGVRWWVSPIEVTLMRVRSTPREPARSSKTRASCGSQLRLPMLDVKLRTRIRSGDNRTELKPSAAW